MPKIDVSWREFPAITVAELITAALKESLQKHLYQRTKWEFGRLDEQIELWASMVWKATQETMPKSKADNIFSEIISATWYPRGAKPLVDVGTDILRENDPGACKFDLPTLILVCPFCSERGPFNPVGAIVENAPLESHRQWFHLSYKCQTCKGESVRFLVRRERTDFYLCGCDPIREVELPPHLPPKIVSKHLRNAIVARQAGQTLSGIFQMRVFVEQYWKLFPEVKAVVDAKPKPTGDELGTAYKSTLPEDFRRQFPTLCEVYDNLSEAMHDADADDQIFDENLKKVARHFDVRRVYELKLPESALTESTSAGRVHAASSSVAAGK